VLNPDRIIAGSVKNQQRLGNDPFRARHLCSTHHAHSPQSSTEVVPTIEP
jgi:hypothetical protein